MKNEPEAALVQIGSVQPCIRVLGPPLLTLPNGIPTKLGSRAAALVALAALEPSITRRRAALMLWPDSAEQLARNNLRTLFHRLSKRCAQEVFGADEQITLLNDIVEPVEQDADALVLLLSAGGVRRCELLCDLDLQELEELQTWLRIARRRIRSNQLDTLNEAHQRAIATCDFGRAVCMARASVALEPLSETLHRRLMETLIARGDREAALAAYEECKVALLDNLGAVPEESTRSLHVRILQRHSGVAVAESSLGLGGNSTALVGREIPMSILERGWARGTHLALQGEAGVGKTRLLRDFLQDKASERISVPASCQSEPYSALAHLIHSVQQRHDLVLGRTEAFDLARVAPHAFPMLKPASAPHSAPRLRAAILLWAAALQEAGVQLLAIDDLHYADLESQDVLASLLSDSAADRQLLGLLLSFRTGDLGPLLSQAIRDAQVSRRLTNVALDRLTRQGVEALLMALGRDASAVERSVGPMMSATGGNPLFVLELALFETPATTYGGSATDEPRAIDLHSLLQARLLSCGPVAQELSHTAVLAEEVFSVDLASFVLDRSALELMPAWTELQMRGLFGDSGLAHDLVRDAVSAAISLEQRKTLHSRIAVFLEGRDQHGARVLRHWLASDQRENAFPHALEVYETRMSSGRPDQDGEILIMELMLAMSDDRLRSSLWPMASFHFEDMSMNALERVGAVVNRVDALPKSDETRVWLATIRQEVRVRLGENFIQTYDSLAPSIASVVVDGAALVWLERFSMGLHLLSGGQRREVFRRVEAAIAKLPDTIEHRGVRRLTEVSRWTFVAGDVSEVRSLAREIRDSRRMGDVAAVQSARSRLAPVLGIATRIPACYRQLRLFADSLAPDELAAWMASSDGRAFAKMALAVGRYDEAKAAFESSRITEGIIDCETAVWMARMFQILGQPELAMQQLELVIEDEINHPSVHLLRAVVVSGVLSNGTESGILALEHAKKRLALANWASSWDAFLKQDVADLSGTVADRIAAGRYALEQLSQPDVYQHRRAASLLSLAQALHDDGRPEYRDFALQGASLARRGIARQSDYVPEMLHRFAFLLKDDMPEAAGALRAVATRWTVRALRSVPEGMLESFFDANERLLVRTQADSAFDLRPMVTADPTSLAKIGPFPLSP